MNPQVNRWFNTNRGNIALFVRVAVAVFLFIVITATLVSFILPETFQGTARVKLPVVNVLTQTNHDPYFIQTECEVMHSELVLSSAIQSLNLNSVWGRKYAAGQSLRTQESLALLRKSLRISPIRDTTIIEVAAFSDRPDEAAMLANTVAESYVALRLETLSNKETVQQVDRGPLIIDRAIPTLEPVRPKKALNITLGCVLGIVFGAGAGILVVAARMAFSKKRATIR